MIESQTISEEYQIPKRIGILGGSFNPPHLGHMQMAIEAINLGYVDEIWIVPCGERKDKQLNVSGQMRLQMVNMLVQEFFRNEFPVKVCDIEIRNGEQIPTYWLMKKFQENYQQMNYEFCFIMGSDLLDGLELWNEGKRMKEEVSFIIFRRSHALIENKTLPKNYILINSIFVASSSSEIRNRIRKYCLNGSQVQDKNVCQQKYMGIYGILPSSIILFIKAQGLYQNQ